MPDMSNWLKTVMHISDAMPFVLSASQHVKLNWQRIAEMIIGSIVFGGIAYGVVTTKLENLEKNQDQNAEQIRQESREGFREVRNDIRHVNNRIDRLHGNGR